MFDAEYFTSLLNETLALSESLSRDYSEEAAEKMDSNVLALSYLSDAIEDEDTRVGTKKRLKSLFLKQFHETNYTRSRDGTAAVDEDKEALEKDLLEYARKLREKAGELRTRLREDDEVVSRAGDAFQRSVAQTRGNVERATEKPERMSMVQAFVISLIFFFLTYALIRFF